MLFWNWPITGYSTWVKKLYSKGKAMRQHVTVQTNYIYHKKTAVQLSPYMEIIPL